MFNARGGFSGQRPIGAPRMNQPAINHHGMNMPGINMPSMNMGGMGMSNINKPNINLSGINQPGMNPGMNRVGPLGMSPNMGLGNLNPPPMDVNRMGLSGMNQGGMGFQPELKGQGFNMRPMDSPGPFLGGNSDSMGMKSMPLQPPMHTAPPPIPQHFPTPPGPMTPAPPRMVSQNQEIPSIVNRVLTHSSDHLLGKVNPALQDAAHIMKEKLGAFGNLSQDLGIKPGPLSSLEPMPGTQNRYTSESASSILESFGLSNEDLEELSRYPDDKLTPLNLPNILRDIRLRKVNRPGVVHDQGGGGRRPGGELLPSKVIDYGHSSKYQINNDPSSRPFESSRTDQKPAVSKEPTASKSNKPTSSPDNAMDNKIPTISVSRKQTSWQTSKSNPSNNKTLVGAHTDGSVNVSTTESPVITIKPESTPLTEVPVTSDAPAVDNSKVNTNAPIGTVVGQGNFQSAEATTPGNANWEPSQNQEDAQKVKRLPTPSMMNDYFASSPRIFPHICSLCNVECRHLKDWIKHQNNTSHIESCRKLRQQYPDWNPQVHTSSSTDAKNDEATANQSKSKSGSPRRARRSGSRHRARRSRSRSPKSGRKSRSRSPRRSRHSPGKSHSPNRGTRSPRFSQSPRRHRRARSPSSPDKKAVDAAVQSFIEASKLKSGEKGKTTKPSSDGRKTSASKGSTSPSKNSSSSNGAVRKSSSSSSHSSSSKKPANSSSSGSAKNPSGGSSSSSAPRKPSSENPTRRTTPSSSTSKKPAVSTGARKTTSSTSFSKRAQPSKPPTSQREHAKSTPSEPCNPLNKFTGKDGSKKIIHVTNLPESGYTDQDILKIIQPFGKVCDILIVRSRNEAFLETNFKEAAAAAVKYSETVPVMINNKRVTLSLAGQSKDKKPESKTSSDTESRNKSPHRDAAGRAQDKKTGHIRGKKEPESKRDIEIPPGFVKCYLLADPPYKDTEKCVVVISNLPEKQSSVDEISNLAKPFGGVNDILVISTHQKAYLELPSRNSVDSMLKFYDVFPVYLAGNLLKIAPAAKYKNLKDENRIFAEIIQDAQFKINPTIYERFVHLSNLPEKEFEDLDVRKTGLKFGQVEHYIVISNKRKAILHMSKTSAAKAMYSFLYKYPTTIGGSVVQCSLAKKTKLAEEEYTTYLEEEKKSSDQGNVALTPDEGEEETGKTDHVEKTGRKEDVKEKTNLQDDIKVKTAKQDDVKEKADSKDEVKEKTDKQNEVQEMTDKQDGQIAQPDSFTRGSEMDVDAAGDLAKSWSIFSQQEDDDEEAAEAPEAPDVPFVFIQPEPVVPKEYNPIPQVYISSESDVLVSVESDEEECEVPAFQNITPVFCNIKKTLTANVSEEHDSDMEESPNDVPCDLELEAAGNPQNSSSQAERNEESDSGVGASEVPGSSSERAGKEESDGSAVLDSSVEESSVRSEDSDKKSKSDSSGTSRKGASKPSEGREKTRHSSYTRSKDETGGASDDAKKSDQVALTRTAKYNPQKGDISVTLTVESQKTSSRTPDSRKRSSRERGSSGRDSSTPKSSSTRSSPSDNSSNNPNSKVTSHQTKSNTRGATSQDKDSKVTSRSRESESRSSNRKEDRSKGSSSSVSSTRYTRSSKGSSRGPRSKEEEDPFPFNLDEFVTVDEIVEEQKDSYSKDDDGRKSQAASTPRRGKRKENYSPASLDAKKAKGAAELSFVTLDEVGDDDENANATETSHIQEDQSLLTVDEVHAEDGPPTKESQILVTLDEVSDDEELPTSAKEPPTLAVPEMLSKDQLLTLDEVNAEDEEQTSHSEPSNPENQEGEKKEEKVILDPEAKEKLEATEVSSAAAVQDSPSEQPLLTLDEVKAEDDEEEQESIGDMEHKFLTVDEIGEDEEDTEVKEDAGTSQSLSSSAQDRNKANTKPLHPAKPPAGRKVRAKKRPLPDTPDDGKDTAQQIPASESENTPVKPKAKTSRGSSKEENTTPNKSEAGDSTPKAETPAKKTKLDSPASGKAKLSPFNSSMPVGMEFLVPKTGYFCELCSLFYMDDASKLKHCKSLRHYQAVQKHLAKEEETAETKSSNT